MDNNYDYNYGAPQAPQYGAPQAPQAPQAPKKLDDLLKGDNKKFLFIGAGALVAVIIIIAIIAGVAGNGYKKPIKAFAEGIQENDGKIVVEAYYEDYFEDGEDDSMEEGIEILSDYLEDECGKGYKVKVEYKDKEKYNKDDIKDFVEDLEDDYGVEYDADDFSKLYEVDVEIFAEGDEDEIDIGDGTFYVAKVDGDWLIIWDEVDMDEVFADATAAAIEDAMQ